MTQETVKTPQVQRENSTNGREPVEVFVSYSHKDRGRRDKLATHLSNLKNGGIIADWFDGDIVAGTEWQQQILEHLNSAQIILLLISSDFMSSSFCYSIELKRAIERHNAHEAHIIPILLRPTDWKDAPFAKLKALPDNGKPISKWSSPDDAYLNVVKGIRSAIQDLQEKNTVNPTLPHQ